LGLKTDKKKKNGATKKKKQPLPAKQNNTAPAIVNKARKTKTSKHKKNNHPNEKTTKGYCHLCGAEGVIVKTISWRYGKAYPYFSFRIKRRKTGGTKKTFPWEFDTIGKRNERGNLSEQKRGNLSERYSCVC
jgi:hypothetical protein